MATITVQGLGEVHSATDLSVYAEVLLTVDGREVSVGAEIGVRESERETARKVGPRGMVDAWWVDASDWAAVGADLRDEALEAILAARGQLFRDSAEARAEAESDAANA